MCSNGCYSQQALARKQEPYVNRCKCGFSDCQNCYSKNKTRDCGYVSSHKQPSERHYCRTARPLQDINPNVQNRHYHGDGRRSHRHHQPENYGQSRRALEYPESGRQRHGAAAEHPLALVQRDPRQYAMYPDRMKSAWMAATYEEVNDKVNGTTAVRMGVQAQWNY